MSKAEKAEQRALEAYPVLMCYNDFQMVEEDINKPIREIYQEGYHQAEEDLEHFENLEEPAGLDKGKLMGMLYESLSKETKESWNKFLQEEPVNKVDVDAAMSEVEAKAKTFTELHKGESSDEILAQMRGEEPVSEELDIAATEYSSQNKFFLKPTDVLAFDSLSCCAKDSFIIGANWQKATLWKPANGEDLPEYDREVIAILDYDFGHYKVIYAHRPNPNGWKGTNIDTGEKEHFEPVIYDKGGWNQPHVLYWLDTKLPYEEKK